MTLQEVKDFRRQEVNHPAHFDLDLVARFISGRKANLLRDLFTISLLKPNESIPWTWVRDTTYKELKLSGITSDHVTKLARELQKALDGQNVGEEWKFTLQDVKYPGERAFHWKLVIDRREGDLTSGVERASRSVKPSKRILPPETVWNCKSFESRTPIWLSVRGDSELSFVIATQGNWCIPPDYNDYELVRERMWLKEGDKKQGDLPICSYKSFRQLPVLSFGGSRVVIDVDIARRSDYLATNGRLIQLLNPEGRYTMVAEFKTTLGPMLRESHFPQGAVNPLNITAIVISNDNRVVLNYFLKAKRWDSPASGFINPFLDLDDLFGFGPCPRKTLARTICDNLGTPASLQSMQWTGLGLNRENGFVTLLGEVRLNLHSKEVEALFKRRWPNCRQVPLFIEFNPRATIEFTRTRPRQFLEIALALSLSRHFDDVKVSALGWREEP